MRENEMVDISIILVNYKNVGLNRKMYCFFAELENRGVV